MLLGEGGGARLHALLEAGLGSDDGAAPSRAVAVSGGGDSTALLLLMHEYCAARGLPLCAVSVDHGLRPEAAGELAAVARLCARLGCAHEVLRWTPETGGGGNLQDRARRARYAMLAGWAARNGVDEVVLGHTRDDLAETFLMRLSREAGLDGLAAMAPRREIDGIAFTRPLLGAGRDELRDYLAGRRESWSEDPTNDDPAYLRVRARRALAALSDLGIEAGTLAAVAWNLADARDLVADLLGTRARAIARVETGALVISREGFAALPDELARRLLVAALVWCGGADYPPRRAGLLRLSRGLAAGQGATLHGCRMLLRGGEIVIAREYAAVARLRCASDALWDGCWRFEGDHAPGLELRALGPAGLAACPDRDAMPLPAVALHPLPGLWREDSLLAAPLLGWPQGWRAQRIPAAPGFLDPANMRI